MLGLPLLSLFRLENHSFWVNWLISLVLDFMSILLSGDLESDLFILRFFFDFFFDFFEFFEFNSSVFET